MRHSHYNIPMLTRLRHIYHEYPPQFWLMVFGVFLSTAGASMIGPFLMIYASEKLGLPLSTVATLITINAGTGLFSSFIAGTLADKVGRKVVMVISLFTNGLIYLFMMRADTYATFAFLMFLTGLANPLYQVGADAMLADLIPQEKRTDAYAINRMLNNAGFAIGPAVGGFIASRSYDTAFYFASAGMLTYSALLFFFARETLAKTAHATFQKIQDGGYAQVFRDRGYLSFIAIVSLGLIAPGVLWVLLAVYTKINFGLPENLYGWLPTTNALMCVFVQYSITRLTRRYRPLPVVAVGMFVYAVGVGAVALMNGFWGFWLAMVILTFGELIVVPTASTFVANISPAHLRGRYMSIYWLSWGISRGAAPLIGGFLNDAIAPAAIWVGGLVIGLTSALGLLILSNLRKNEQVELAA
jgi:MFS family permease